MNYVVIVLDGRIAAAYGPFATEDMADAWAENRDEINGVRKLDYVISAIYPASENVK